MAIQAPPVASESVVYEPPFSIESQRSTLSSAPISIVYSEFLRSILNSVPQPNNSSELQKSKKVENKTKKVENKTKKAENKTRKNVIGCKCTVGNCSSCTCNKLNKGCNSNCSCKVNKCKNIYNK